MQIHVLECSAPLWILIIFLSIIGAAVSPGVFFHYQVYLLLEHVWKNLFKAPTCHFVLKKPIRLHCTM